MSIKDLTNEVLEQFMATYNLPYDTDGVVIKSNDVTFEFDREEP